MIYDEKIKVEEGFLFLWYVYDLQKIFNNPQNIKYVKVIEFFARYINGYDLSYWVDFYSNLLYFFVYIAYE